MSGRLLVVVCVVATLAGIFRPAAAVPAATVAAVSPGLSGMHPLPGDAPVPAKWLPPGAPASDTGPSSVVFPPQKMTLRFNHKKHLKEAGASCATCHAKAKTSAAAEDSLLPAGTACDVCHDTDHTNLKQVSAGSDEMGQCTFCHLGSGAAGSGRVVPVDIPTPNLHFSHKAHADRNIQCGQCHGSIDELELATRDQLPRMKGCFGCHNMSGAAQGEAKSDCKICHVAEPSGSMRVMFASGELKPPRWMMNAEHTPDFLERHKRVAGDDSALCANCHTERYCADCHDGRVRPRSVHPNDWISMHPVAARQDNPRCTSCHQQQSFCLSCHQRIGVTMTGPNATGNKFHPAGFVGTPINSRSAGHHAWEAQRNLNACVSCHTERDCAMCHASSGRGGLSVNPHPGSFLATCATQLRRNGRPCLVCHEATSSAIASCQ